MFQKGIVFNIQRNSLHDGPGIRTSVFLKGCPLRCRWCCNPESQTIMPELANMTFKCVACGACAHNCPMQAIHMNEDGKPVRDVKKCVNCGTCKRICKEGAWKYYGKEVTVEDVLREVFKDEAFYRKSGGGVTFTGGEPSLQGEFLRELLKGAKDAGIHTAIETCGHMSREYLQSILPFVDLFIIDIKHMDSEKHKELIGIGNEVILENARYIAQSGARHVFRIPLIPGLNDTEDNLQETGKFVKSLGDVHMVVLKFHQLGSAKYDYLQKEYSLKMLPSMEDDAVNAAIDILEKYIPLVSVGGT